MRCPFGAPSGPLRAYIALAPKGQRAQSVAPEGRLASFPVGAREGGGSEARKSPQGTTMPFGIYCNIPLGIYCAFKCVDYVLFLKTPQVGLEPTTNRLTADRSTTELLKIK